jgi:hypothetical protein
LTIIFQIFIDRYFRDVSGREVRRHNTFINLLWAKNMELVEQCAATLDNIIVEGTEYRNLMIEQGILAPLLSVVCENLTPSLQRTLSGVFLSLVRYREHQLSVESWTTCCQSYIN